MLDQPLAQFAPADQQLRQAAGRIVAEIGGNLLEKGLHRERGQRGLLRRFPDQRIAAHQRQRRIPAPHRDREVERGNDADRAGRMPLFDQPVVRALRRHRQAVELARQAHREVADVDHLLDFAQPFGQDLPGLDRHEPAERVLVQAKLLAQPAHELAAARRGHQPPLPERSHGRRHRGVAIPGRVHRQLGQRLAGDGGGRHQRPSFQRRCRHAEIVQDHPDLIP